MRSIYLPFFLASIFSCQSKNVSQTSSKKDLDNLTTKAQFPNNASLLEESFGYSYKQMLKSKTNPNLYVYIEGDEMENAFNTVKQAVLEYDDNENNVSCNDTSKMQIMSFIDSEGRTHEVKLSLTKIKPNQTKINKGGIDYKTLEWLQYSWMYHSVHVTEANGKNLVNIRNSQNCPTSLSQLQLARGAGGNVLDGAVGAKNKVGLTLSFIGQCLFSGKGCPEIMSN